MGTLSKLARSLSAFHRELSRIAPAAPANPRVPGIGLALGGGFARGLSHIGVLKVLEQEKIPVSFIAGTSVGALIGAVYASGVCPKEMEEIAGLIRFRHFARWTVSRLGFASNDRMTTMLQRFLKVKTFEELRIPLAVIATDFVSGEPVVFRSGELIGPVRASCAYPGMFLPVTLNGRTLVDGMLAYSVPTTPLREMGAERVLAVYLKAHWVNPGPPRSVFDVIGQCFSIAQTKMCSLWQADADVIMEPEVQDFGYDSFDRAPALVRAGEEAARRALPRIRQFLQQPAPAPAPVMPPQPAAVKILA
ncbi:MAG: patatin-like phospholipase family protein [Terriglobales bacterium]